MKAKHIIYLLLAVMPLYVSCMKELPDSLKVISVSTGDTPQESKSMKVSVESLSFSSNEEEQSFSVTSNVSWRVACDADWVTLTESTTRGTGNGTVKVSVKENSSIESRTATVTISSTDAGSVKVIITQAGDNLELKLNKNDMSFVAAGGSDSFTITCNTSWTVTSDQSWCTVSSSSGSGNTSITVYVSENSSTDSRSATITVKAGDITQDISVTQGGVTPPDQGTRTFTVNGVSFKMIRVDGGTFTMGATSEQGSDARSNEKPIHSVTLSTYYMGETEVTQELWQAVMGNNPSFNVGSRKPVDCVSWNDCQDFVTRLSNLTGANFRLPTEAEWEFAARGGNNSQGYKYSGSNTIDDVAWYHDNWTIENTHDVAQKLPNELGLYDMTGNVEEWCQDWYGNYSSSSQTNPTGPTTGTYRVSRGGDWYTITKFCHVSFRNSDRPGYKTDSRGLRLAL